MPFIDLTRGLRQSEGKSRPLPALGRFAGSTRADRRVRLLTLTEEGQSVMAKMQPMVNRAQERILAPLSKTDRKEFMRMIKVLVSTNNDLSRAPSEGV